MVAMASMQVPSHRHSLQGGIAIVMMTDFRRSNTRNYSAHQGYLKDV